MKAAFSEIIVFLLWAGGSFLLPAQTNTGAAVNPGRPAAERENGMISFLTPAEQEQYAKAHEKALADNPALKAEGEKLKVQGEALLADGKVSDRQAFIEMMNSHRQKLREAMLKEDPTLEPIFVKIDKNISELKAKATERLHALQKSYEATNAPPSNSPAAR